MFRKWQTPNVPLFWLSKNADPMNPMWFFPRFFLRFPWSRLLTPSGPLGLGPFHRPRTNCWCCTWDQHGSPRPNPYECRLLTCHWLIIFIIFIIYDIYDIYDISYIWYMIYIYILYWSHITRNVGWQTSWLPWCQFLNPSDLHNYGIISPWMFRHSTIFCHLWASGISISGRALAMSNHVKPCETMWNHVSNHVRKHKFWFCTYTDDGTQKRDLTTSPAPLTPLSLFAPQWHTSGSHFPNWWPVSL